MQPTPGPNSRRRADWRIASHDENARPVTLRVGASICSLARPDPEGSLNRRQSKAGRYHARWRRSIAKYTGGRGHIIASTCQGWKRKKCHALAALHAQTQTAQAGGRGIGEQNCADRLENDGHRRNLSKKRRAIRVEMHGIRDQAAMVSGQSELPS